MFFQDQIDAAGKKSPAPAMDKTASVSDNDDLALADLMDKYASIHDGGEGQDVITQQALGDLTEEGQTGDKAALTQGIRSQLTELGVLQ